MAALMPKDSPLLQESKQREITQALCVNLLPPMAPLGLEEFNVGLYGDLCRSDQAIVASLNLFTNGM